jgi:hypothetical protein
MRIHQAIQLRPPKMEMVSEGKRGRIWRVDEGCEDIAGAVLQTGTVRIPDGRKERFGLFGLGRKEVLDDVLLISEVV